MAPYPISFKLNYIISLEKTRDYSREGRIGQGKREKILEKETFRQGGNKSMSTAVRISKNQLMDGSNNEFYRS